MIKLLYSMFLLSLLLGGLACKKDSKFNPACQEDKLVPAYIYGSSCEYGMVRLVDDNGDIMQQNGWSGLVRWKNIPKEYRLSEGDSMRVNINYVRKGDGYCLLHGDPCYACKSFKIRCIQN